MTSAEHSAGTGTTEYPWPVHPAAALFPLMNQAALADLAADIGLRGLNEPVWLYRDPERGTVLLDGRNRVAACRLAGVTPTTRIYTGDDPIGFSISQNVKRRHLTSGQLDFLALEVEKLYAAEAAKRRGHGQTARGRSKGAALPVKSDATLVADLPQALHPVESEEPLVTDLLQGTETERKSRERAAQVVGTSGRGVSQAKRIAERAPDLAEKVIAGVMPIDRADRIIRDREAERRKVEQARAQAATTPEPLRVDIRLGDFQQVLADLSGVDAVVTDPPYPREYLPLLGDLAAWADTVLAPNGVLAVMIGQSYLPEVLRQLDGFRPYRWVICCLTPGAGYVSHPRAVQSNWKPILVYGQGKRFADVIHSEGTDSAAKHLHRWGQDYAAFHTLIERLTDPGQTVADPFLGSGTTLLAAHALGRHVVGCDIDEAAVATSRERLE